MATCFDHFSISSKVKFTLEQATYVRRGVDVLLYCFFNLGIRWGWVVNATPGQYLIIVINGGVDGE